MTLLDKVKKLCADNKTTIAAVEKELGFGNGSIRKWDGASPAFDRIIKLARYFNVTAEFFAEDNAPDDTIPRLSKEDKHCLDLFRSLDPATRRHFLEVLRAAGKG